MKWSEWLANWNMTSLQIKPPFLQMEWKPADDDMAAAWDLYIELLTRITTQELPDEDGDEATALTSIYSLFALTRTTIKTHGRHCTEFTKIAIVVLNQAVRPFTAKWHKRSLAGDFKDPIACAQFREELTVLQRKLRIYTKMLAEMAGVEDLTELEED